MHKRYISKKSSRINKLNNNNSATNQIVFKK